MPPTALLTPFSLCVNLVDEADEWERKKRGKSAEKPMSVGSHDANVHEDSDSHDDQPLSLKKAKIKQEPTENEAVTEKEEVVETEEDREEKDKGRSEDGKEDMVKVHVGKALENREQTGEE